MVSVGLNVTSTLQLFPGFNVFAHCFLTAKGAAVVSPMTVTLIPECFESLFLIVSSFLPVLPTLVLSPKFRVCGLNDGMPKGVGVGDGVAVMVGVAVAVAVLVAVAVGVAVAVLVAVAVAVAVAN